MDHAVLVLAHSMSTVWLPVRDSLEAGPAWFSQRVCVDKTLFVVGDVLTWVAQVRHISLRGRAKWRAGG